MWVEADGRIDRVQKIWLWEPQGAIPIPTCDAKETEPPASTASCGLGQGQLNGNHKELR